MNRRILALDLATSTGWCHGEPGTKPQLGSVRFAPDGTIAARGCALLDWMSDHSAFFDPWLIVYEAPLKHDRQSSQQSARTAFGLSMAVEMFCHRQGLRCMEGNVQMARNAVLGRGHHGKQSAWEACRHFGLNPPDLDASDAWVIWRYAALTRAPTGPVPMPVFRKNVA